MKLIKLFENENFEFLLYEFREIPISFILDKPSNLWYVCPDLLFESVNDLSQSENEPELDEFLDLLNEFKAEHGLYPRVGFPDVLFPELKKDVQSYITQMKTTMIFKYGT